MEARCLHGYGQATLAAKEAYIVTKKKDGKESCLVSISVAQGEKQASILAKLMDQLEADSRLTKAKLADFKTSC